MHEVLIGELQAENESLRKRVAELEHTLEIHEWGAQLFHESDIPQLLLDFETGAILAANAAARTFYGEALIGCGDIMCVCAEELDWAHGIQKAAERAADLNKQLLAYARRQVIQPAPMNLGEWLQGTLDILRRVLPESVRLRTEIEPNLWQVNADSNLLMQIVLNLVVNARDAMPNGGVITLRVHNKTLRRTRTHHIPNGRYVLLEVEDTGTGIPPEVLPHIFEPFYTTKPMGQGTGMGLAAVQGAVQQLGGYIEVRTEVGKGTCFSIYFPRLEPSKSPKSREQ
jgi:signal transduction histidine kinase